MNFCKCSLQLPSVKTFLNEIHMVCLQVKFVQAETTFSDW